MSLLRGATGLCTTGCCAIIVCLMNPLPGRSQDLVGCQLTDEGQLQCVPGVSADPQSQIRALRQAIAVDQQLEGAVQQQINGMDQLVLAGQAAQGQLLKATVAADALAGLPPSAFHWYRLTPGSNSWVLISEASGPSYRLQAEDVQARVMVVVARPTSTGGSQRQPSGSVGPIQPATP
jgi:hypothetical protein